MPGKLAAARASREVSERLAQLPRRLGSNGNGLPADLDDASAPDTASSVAKVTGSRNLWKGSTEASAAASGKQLDGATSGPSVTFLVSSGQHAATPASAQGVIIGASAQAGQLAGAPVAGHVLAGSATSPRTARPPAATPTRPADGSGSSGSQLSGTPMGRAASVPRSHQPGAGAGNIGSVQSSSQPRSERRVMAPAADASADASVGSNGASSQGALSSTNLNVGAGSQGTGEAAEQVWTAVARPDRTRSLGTPATAVPLRHSRLRVTGRRTPEPEVDGTAVVGEGSASSRRATATLLQKEDLRQLRVESAQPVGAPGPGLDLPSPDVAATSCNVVSSERASHVGSATGASNGGAAAAASKRSQRLQGANGNLGSHGDAPAGSTVGLAPEELPVGYNSADSSSSVRQTPSDAEDEVLERARARRAMRSAAIAAATAAVVNRPSGSSGAGSEIRALGLAMPPAALHPSPKPHYSYAAGGSGAPPVAIRLNHQPGHHRRPPNRHASMPAMKRGAGSPALGAAGAATCGGPVEPGDGGVPNGHLRPPLSGGLNPSAESGPPDSPGNASLPLGLLGSGGAAGTNGGSYFVSAIMRAPSDSPITSQLSMTSSYVGPGPGSTAYPRYTPLQVMPATPGSGTGTASGPGGFPSATSPSLAAQAGQAPSRLASGLPQVTLPVSLVARGLSGGNGVGSSGQQGSFEEEGARVTPAFVGGSGSAVPGALMQSHQSHLVLTSHPSGFGMGLAAGDRPSHVSSRMLSGAHAQHTSNLSALHKAVEKLMLQDSGLYAKVQASMKGISSLAKETNKLDFCRDASGATVINQYVVVKTLGRGAFGKVKLCLNTLDGQLYAVKMINRAHLLRQLQKPARPLRRRAPPPRNTSDTGLMHLHLQRTQTEGNLSISHTNAPPTPSQAAAPARASMDDMSPMAAIMREIAVMKKVDHPHVVRLHEVIDPPGSSYLMMVMEYCEGGCVMETRAQTGLTPLGEETAREYFRQACMGLDYLHYNNVVHGDLKPENMLVSGSGLLKIADFGSSRFMGGDPTDATKTSCTPAFQSPEEIGHMPVDPFAADLWALACCLYCFVFGRLPFVGSCVVDIYRAILTRPHTYPPEAACSPALRDLLDRMLHKDPRKRLALREVGHHEWVTAGGSLPPLPCLQSLASGARGDGGEAPPPVIHVTHAEQVNAIDRSSLVSLIRARLKEKTCQPGEYLFKEGEEAHCVYMIMAGVVELTQHLRRPSHNGHHLHNGGSSGGPNGVASRGAGVGSGPSAGGAAADGGYMAGPSDHDASFSVDLDESLTLDHPEGGHITEAMNIVDGKLHIDRQQAIEMRRRMQGNLLGDNAEYVVEVKGPGSVIGELGMDTAVAATHRVSARARGPVTVVKLTEENFFKALLAMYGGTGGGGSAASTTLTASSVSEATGRPGGAAAAPTPALSAQQLMVMQYLEDSGSHAMFPASAGGVAVSGAGGRFSMDSGLSGRGTPLGHHYHGAHHRSSAAAAAGAAAAAIKLADGALDTGKLLDSVVGTPTGAVSGAAAAMKMSGAHSMLGVLNTIHSINASRAGGNTSEEGVADL